MQKNAQERLATLEVAIPRANLRVVVPAAKRPSMVLRALCLLALLALVQQLAPAAAYTCEPEALGVNGCDRSVGPAGPSQGEYDTWWSGLNAWSERRRAQLLAEQPETGDFSAYDNPDIDWARTAFVQPQAMIHDRYLYDRATDEWTVDRFLDDFETRYGGIDRARSHCRFVLPLILFIHQIH